MYMYSDPWQSSLNLAQPIRRRPIWAIYNLQPPCTLLQAHSHPCLPFPLLSLSLFITSPHSFLLLFPLPLSLLQLPLSRSLPLSPSALEAILSSLRAPLLWSVPSSVRPNQSFSALQLLWHNLPGLSSLFPISNHTRSLVLCSNSLSTPPTSPLSTALVLALIPANT